MATKIFRFFDTPVSGYGELDEAPAPASAITTTTCNWNIKGGSGAGDGDKQMSYAAAVSMVDGVFDTAAAPNGSNGFRSLNTLNGSFAAGTWQLFVEQNGTGGTAGVSVEFGFRLYRGTNQNGTGAVPLDAAASITNTHAYSTTRAQVSGTTPALSAVTFTNEYLFVTLNFTTFTTTDTTGTTSIWVNGTELFTPDFTAVVNSTSSPSDIVTETDTASGGYGTSAIDAATQVDTASVAGTFLNSPIDSTTESDTASGAGIFRGLPGSSDSGTTTDKAIATFGSVSLSDFASVVEAASGIVMWVTAAVDTVTVIDLSSAFLVIGPSFIEKSSPTGGTAGSSTTNLKIPSLPKISVQAAAAPAPPVPKTLSSYFLDVFNKNLNSRRSESKGAFLQPRVAADLAQAYDSWVKGTPLKAPPLSLISTGPVQSLAASLASLELFQGWESGLVNYWTSGIWAGPGFVPTNPTIVSGLSGLSDSIRAYLKSGYPGSVQIAADRITEIVHKYTLRLTVMATPISGAPIVVPVLG